MTVSTAVIIAGGMGTRLGNRGNLHPKGFTRIGGKPIIEMSLAKLAKSMDVPRDVIMQAIGWLAREEKVELEEASRGRIIRLI